MKNKFSAFALLYFLLVFLNACKQSDSTLAIYVPKDASAVFVIDTKAITDKIASSGITVDSLVNLFQENHSGDWEDIKNSGVDFSTPFYIFSKETRSIQQGHVQSGGLIAKVDDENKLAAFFKKKKADATVEAGKGFKYIKIEDDVVAGWTDKVLIITGVKDYGISSEDSLLQSQLTTLFTQKKSESIASLDAFETSFAKQGDILYYSNIGAKLNDVPMAGMSKINDLLENSYTNGVINFENGKIDATGETHYNKTLSGIIDKYPTQNIKTDVLKNYPDTLTAFGIISFNPKLVVDILHYLGVDGMADGFASDMGFTTKDVLNAFSGDIAVMISSHPEKTMENSLKDGGFLVAAGIGDRAAFDKVTNGLVAKGLLSKNGDEYKLGTSGGHGFVIKTGSTNLLVGSSNDLITAFQSPGGSRPPLPADVEKELNNKTMALYFDINKFLQNKPVKDSISINTKGNNDHYAIAKNAKETFKNFLAFADKGEGNVITSHYELNFVNGNENSLASLARFITVLHNEGVKTGGFTMHPPLSGLKDADSTVPEDNTGNEN